MDESGKQIGVVTKLEALQKAKELGIDVVEVAPNAKPPVAKLIDYKKFKYQEAKKDRESKKSQKHVGIKEVRMRPFIGEHDLVTLISRAQGFLKEGNQLKINVIFRGRELARKQFGYDVIRKFIERLDSAKLVREPHMEGKVLAAMVANVKKGENHAKDENEKNSSKTV